MRVLVTGASGALGSQVVQRFLSAGNTVVGLARKAPRDREAAGPSEWIELDAGDAAGVNARVPEEFDVLVHCAGGFRFGKIGELSTEDFEFLLNANVRSTFNLVARLLPGMKRRNFGRIVLVGAKATSNPGAGMGGYAASKAAINMLTLSLAEEVKGFDINVNAVLPSIIDTPANRTGMPHADPSTWVSVGELSEIIFSLTQPWGKALHGALIPVAGRV
ncbi:MAG: SDR family NAD(P)-dependent oxidoreductase [Oligoflexia bacterium]|nr:SDR family NAD(P)-dependent oxidoreductase [Oligoflexia bacterium]